MYTVFFHDESIRMPDRIRNLDAFRRWAHSDEFPQKGRICFLDGDLWADMTAEQIFSHAVIKNEIAYVLTGIEKETSCGSYFPHGALLTNEEANFSCQPDGTFVQNKSFREDRVRPVKGESGGYVELEGTPDIVLEVESASSIKKDREILRELYWRAGIPEYWLVDARSDQPEFEILRHGATGYSATRKSSGWIKSRVLGASFRLTRGMDDLGHPTFSLSVR
jgi:Putative restriction endonuclease